jgi:hypothetical protein
MRDVCWTVLCVSQQACPPFPPQPPPSHRTFWGLIYTSAVVLFGTLAASRAGHGYRESSIMRPTSLLAELGLAASLRDRNDVVAVHEPDSPVIARIKAVAASVKVTCKRHAHCSLWVSVTATRIRRTSQHPM